jgi:hypothetical protein
MMLELRLTLAAHPSGFFKRQAWPPLGLMSFGSPEEDVPKVPHITHVSPPTHTPAQIVYLTAEAAATGAVCLDGSPAAYYFRAEAESTKFYIHQEGGGWCSSDEDCGSRSKTALGSSKGYAASMNLGGGYFSNDPTVSPMMFNWTKIFLPYCDGGSQTGDFEPSVSTTKGTIYFRGHRILVAMQANLLANATVGLAQATDLVISGCSAGGLSTFLHADSWAAALPADATVVAMPDSGFFLDYNATNVAFSYEDLMRWVYTRMNATASVYAPACGAANSADPALCIFSEYVSRTMSTPTFPLQSQYDSWQVGNDLFAKSGDKSAINAYGALLTARVETDLLAAAPAKHGVFLDSCYHHCGNEFNAVTVDGMSQATAMQAWYNSLGQAGARKEWKQGQVYPCAACCQPQ